jgi:Cu+-exporting ATPase
MNENAVTLREEMKTQLEELRREGKTTMLLAENKKIVGTVAVADTVKPSAKQTVEALQKMKIDVIMITGDNKETASAIAGELGIKSYPQKNPRR